jgi:hypothetical protein
MAKVFKKKKSEINHQKGNLKKSNKYGTFHRRSILLEYELNNEQRGAGNYNIPNKALNSNSETIKQIETIGAKGKKK